MLKHWEPLTLFLRVPGAPLDNNLCEQVLKQAILHRKNSLFFKTEHGAYIGDLFMSLIYTCRLNRVNPFHYLTTLQKHSSELFKNPRKWLPWNYLQTAMNPAQSCKSTRSTLMPCQVPASPTSRYAGLPEGHAYSSAHGMSTD